MIQLVDSYTDAHETLLFAQEDYPIAGFVIVSPITLVIGLIELIGGLIGSIVTLPLHCLHDDHPLREAASFTNLTAGLGAMTALSALSNILTVGQCMWPL